MIAYRIENEGGFGPFRGDPWEGQDGLLQFANSRLDHPIPCADGLNCLTGWYPDDQRYAAPSLKKLHSWFGPFLASLHEAGFRVVAYKLGPARDDDDENWRIGKSGTQIAFIPHHAKKLWESKISEVFELTETENVV